ncbi:unnamed protein product [Closterium sp. NIES-65]|nr:unnamed protein product [Closterium sp. NIES-65]
MMAARPGMPTRVIINDFRREMGWWDGVVGGMVWLVGWCGWWDGVVGGMVWLVGWCGWWDGVVGGMVWLVGWCGWWDGVVGGMVWLVGWCGWWDGVVGGMVWLIDEIASKHHPHLVRLLGYCVDYDAAAESMEQIAIYEFMPNGDLHHRLHGDGDTVGTTACAANTRAHTDSQVSYGCGINSELEAVLCCAAAEGVESIVREWEREQGGGGERGMWEGRECKLFGGEGGKADGDGAPCMVKVLDT